MSPLIELPPVDNLADLLERLGDVPLDRVRMQPPPGLATEEDVIIALEAPRKRICELVDGVLVEKAMGYSESVLAAYLIVLLDAWIRPRNLGLVSSPDGTLRMWPGRVRIPDVTFTSWDRFPDRKRPREPIPTVAPDLAVEILSVTNTKKEMRLKREDLFRVGVRLIWEIDPELRTVMVYANEASADAVLTENDTLDASPVLPGLMISLRDFFSELDRQGS